MHFLSLFCEGAHQNGTLPGVNQCCSIELMQLGLLTYHPRVIFKIVLATPAW